MTSCTAEVWYFSTHHIPFLTPHPYPQRTPTPHPYPQTLSLSGYPTVSILSRLSLDCPYLSLVLRMNALLHRSLLSPSITCSFWPPQLFWGYSHRKPSIYSWLVLKYYLNKEWISVYINFYGIYWYFENNVHVLAIRIIWATSFIDCWSCLWYTFLSFFFPYIKAISWSVIQEEVTMALLKPTLVVPNKITYSIVFHNLVFVLKMYVSIGILFIMVAVNLYYIYW